MKPPLKQGMADDFQTPEQALEVLYPFLNKEWIIWECAEGRGNLTRAFTGKGWSVCGSDILLGKDFLSWQPNQFDVVITNPPYSLKEKFLERCYSLGKPFALLMPLTALESEKRQKMFREHGIQLIIPNKRYNFETPSGKGGGSWFATAWFTFGLNLPKDLNFVNIK